MIEGGTVRNEALARGEEAWLDWRRRLLGRIAADAAIPPETMSEDERTGKVVKEDFRWAGWSRWD